MYIVTYNDLQVPAKIQIEANSAQQAIFLAKQRWQQRPRHRILHRQLASPKKNHETKNS